MAKVALLFYVMAFGVLAAALAAVWLMTEALGLAGQFEDFMSGVGFRGFRIMSTMVVLGVTSDADDVISPPTSTVRTPIFRWRSLTSTPS